MIKELGVKITQKKASASRDECSTNIYQASIVIHSFSTRTGRKKGNGAGRFRWDTNIMTMRTEVGGAALLFIIYASETALAAGKEQLHDDQI